jgi:probable rRNA maturation factor
MALFVEISADSKFPVERKRIRTLLEKAWKEYGFSSEARVSIAVVGTRKMAALHKEFKNKEGATDVLAFAQQEFEKKNYGFVSAANEPLELGDVVICYPLALEQAARLGVLVDERIGELVLHGFRNLMGNGE